MKIAICGAHKVGKTTLAEELLAHIPGYSFEMEPYYQPESAGYEFFEDPVAEDFIEQFNYSVKMIYKVRNNVIFERCVLDILAYIHVLEPDRNIQSLFEVVRAIIGEIDLCVFVLLRNLDLVPGHQTELPQLRALVNDCIHDWIRELGVEAIEVLGTVWDRREQILAQIS